MQCARRDIVVRIVLVLHKGWKQVATMAMSISSCHFDDLYINVLFSNWRIQHKYQWSHSTERAEGPLHSYRNVSQCTTCRLYLLRHSCTTHTHVSGRLLLYRHIPWKKLFTVVRMLYATVREHVPLIIILCNHLPLTTSLFTYSLTCCSHTAVHIFCHATDIGAAVKGIRPISTFGLARVILAITLSWHGSEL